MKKMLSLLLALMLMLSLCSCGEEGGGKKNDVPGNELIQQDLVNALKTENEHATLKSCETVKSLTEEGKYLITMSVTAETKYADWTYEADLSYTKYDQGWVVDSVTWTDKSYKLSRLPEASDIAAYANQSNILLNNYGKYLPVNTGEIFDSNLENEVCLFSWTASEPLRHATRQILVKSRWTYHAENDTWEIAKYNNSDQIDTITKDYIPRNVNLSGTWGSHGIFFEISNFTWDSFNLKINGKDYGCFTKSSSSTSFKDAQYISSLNSSLTCSFTFYKNLTCIICTDKSVASIPLSANIE